MLDPVHIGKDMSADVLHDVQEMEDEWGQS